MIQTAFICNDPTSVARVYGLGRRERIAALSELAPGVAGADDLTRLGAVEAAFSTWGMPNLTEAQLDMLPKLRIVFYAASSVKHFAPPLMARGITVVAAGCANAIPVAECAVSQILLSNKGYFQNIRAYHSPESRSSWAKTPPRGNFGAEVALLGMGMVGRATRELLRAHALRVLAYDPYLTEEEAARLDVERVTLAEAFRRAHVVSNHMPDIPATRGLLTAALFDSMPAGATFVNTGRGATVVEADLAAVLARRPDLTALLDVTMPEPPEADSPLYHLPNAFLSSHTAGSLGDEVVRMADYCIEEFLAYRDGKPLRYAIDPAKLAIMA